MANTRINPFARPASKPAPVEQPKPAPKPRPAPARKPQVDLETIRVLLYLSTSPRLTKTHRDACRDAAAALR